MLIALGLAAVVGAISVAALRAHGKRLAGREAARVLLHDLQSVAHQARTEGRARGVVLSPTETGGVIAEYVDGNGNGIRAAEVSSGVDPPAGATRSAFAEGRARLAIVRPVPSTDYSTTLAPGSPPVRFGVSPLIVFTPKRTGSSGSIYVAGPDDAQYAIRILGTTMRWRLLCLDARTTTWETC